jgi:hypothetical protein
VLGDGVEFTTVDANHASENCAVRMLFELVTPVLVESVFE